jgi:hypothetical protein
MSVLLRSENSERDAPQCSDFQDAKAQRKIDTFF